MKGGAGNECSKKGDTCYTSEFKTQFLNLVGESDVIFFEYYPDGEDTLGKKFIILKPKKEVENYLLSSYIIPKEGTVALFANSTDEPLQVYVPAQEFYFDRIKQGSIKPVPKNISDAREARPDTKLAAGQTITKYITETLSEKTSEAVGSFEQGFKNITGMSSTTQETAESKGAKADAEKIKQLLKDKISEYLKNIDLILSPKENVVDEDVKQMNDKLDVTLSYLFPFLEYQHIVTDLGLAKPEDKTTKFPVAFLDKLSQIVNKYGNNVLPAIKKINEPIVTQNKPLFITLDTMEDQIIKLSTPILTFNHENIPSVSRSNPDKTNPDPKKSGMVVGMYKTSYRDAGTYPVILSSDGKFLISNFTNQGFLKINATKTLCPNEIKDGYLYFTYNTTGCALVGTRKSQSASAQASRNLGSVGTSVKSTMGSVFSRSATASTTAKATPPPTKINTSFQGFGKGGNKRLTKKIRKQKKQQK